MGDYADGATVRLLYQTLHNSMDGVSRGVSDLRKDVADAFAIAHGNKAAIARIDAKCEARGYRLEDVEGKIKKTDEDKKLDAKSKKRDRLTTLAILIAAFTAFYSFIKTIDFFIGKS